MQGDNFLSSQQLGGLHSNVSGVVRHSSVGESHTISKLTGETEPQQRNRSKSSNSDLICPSNTEIPKANIKKKSSRTYKNTKEVVIDSFFEGSPAINRRYCSSPWKCVSGNICISILSAFGFDQKITKMEPYVVILVDEAKTFKRRGKTKTIKKCSNLQWNHDFVIDVSNSSLLQIRVKGHDKMKEENWAYGVVSLSKFVDHEVHLINLKLYPEGCIQFTCSFTGSTTHMQSPVDLAIPKGGFPYFGQDINSLCQMEGSIVPAVVVSCIEDIESRRSNIGMEEEGIYRISGTQTKIMAIKEKLDALQQVNFSEETKNVHDISGLLKLFFRELPEPIFTFALYDEFISILDEESEKKQREGFYNTILKLPEVNRCCVVFLFTHLNNVMYFTEFNKMTSINLATCFGPTLMRMPNSGGLAGNIQQNHVKNEKGVVELLLRLWPIKGLVSKLTSVASFESIKSPSSTLTLNTIDSQSQISPVQTIANCEPNNITLDCEPSPLNVRSGLSFTDLESALPSALSPGTVELRKDSTNSSTHESFFDDNSDNDDWFTEAEMMDVFSTELNILQGADITSNQPKKNITTS